MFAAGEGCGLGESGLRSSPSSCLELMVSVVLSDVQRILEVAIVQAKLARTEEEVTGFAAMLAPFVLEGVEALYIRDQIAAAPKPVTGPQVVKPVSAPVTVQQQAPVPAAGEGLLSIAEALSIRNKIAQEIDPDQIPSKWPTEVSERLLLLGFIDVPAVQVALDMEHVVPARVSEPAAITGIQVVQTLSGSNPIIR